MRIELSEFAAAELNDAYTYYELQLPGLGVELRQEITNTLKRIKAYPYAWPVDRGTIRKALLNKFPYKILFSIEDNIILVIAIAHQHREPDYWLETWQSTDS